MSVDFRPVIPDPEPTPDRGNYTDLTPFRFWCQKVMPLVYDESLSYYEVLCKTVDYLNKTMEDVGVLNEDIESLYTAFTNLTDWSETQIDALLEAYTELQDYVNNYFDNLNVQDEINHKLDAMAANGTLSALIQPFVTTQLPGIVTTWLAANITEPEGVVIDTSLTISGACADAKAAGDAISEVKNALGEFLTNELGEAGNFDPQNSWFTSSASGYSVTDNVAVFTATARYGGIKTAEKVTMTSGHKFYGFATVSGSDDIFVNFDGYGDRDYPTGTGYRFTSVLADGDGAERRLAIVDNSASDWTQTSVKNCGVIDLTETFGEYTPSKEKLDEMIQKAGFFLEYPLGLFVSQFYIDSNSSDFIPNVLGDIGNFTASTTWYTSSASGYSIINNVAQFTATARFGGIKTTNTISLQSGHKYYAFAKVKSDDNIRLNFDGYADYHSLYDTGEEYDIASCIYTSDGVARRIIVFDNDSSDFSITYVKDAGLIDLTENFDVLPTKEQLDSLVSKTGFFYNYPLSDFCLELFNEINTNKYRYANLSDKTIVIIGDSIAETNYIINGELSPHKTNWPTYAGQLLNSPTIYNLAQDGTSYHEPPGAGQYQTFEGQYNYMVSKGYDPDIIIVALGTNDIQWPHTDTYESAMAIENKSDLDKNNLYQCIRWAHWTLTENYPGAVIIVATLTQRASASVYTYVREATIKMGETYCINLFDATTESGIIKQFETVGSEGRYLLDGLHPNEAGKQLLGDYFAKKITKLLT